MKKLLTDDWKKSQTFIPSIEPEEFIPIPTKDLWILEVEEENSSDHSLNS